MDHYAFDLEKREYSSRRVVKELSRHLTLRDYDFVLLPDYAWSNYLTADVTAGIRAAGCTAKIIVGGYEVTATPDEDMADDYPLADFCIKGYAEEAVFEVITGKTQTRVLQIPIDASTLPLRSRQALTPP